MECGSGLDLVSRFKGWRPRAEACCEAATQLGLTIKTRVC